MEIRVGNIRYIYTFTAAPPEPPGAAGVFGLSGAQSREKNSLLASLGALIGGAGNKAEQEKLEELRRTLASVLNNLHRVPGGKMKAKILAAAAEIVQQAQNGDVAGALLAAQDLKALSDRCVAAGDRIGSALGQISNMAVTLPGAGKQIMANIMTTAKEMIGAADTPDDLEKIAGMLERAVDIGNQMQNTKVGSPEYKACVEALAEVASDLNDMRQAGADDPAAAMEQDALALTFRSAAETMAELKGKTTDAVKQKQIGHLEGQLDQIEQKAAKLPEAMRALLQSAIHHIITDTANGKVGEAQAAADKLHSVVDQAGKLNTVVQAKLELGAKIAGRLEGPAKAGLEAVLAKAEAARQLAKTPEDLLKIDGVVLEAIRHAQQPTKAPGTQQLQARKLKSLERQLADGPPQANFGDRLTLAQATKPAAEKAEGLPTPEVPGVPPHAGKAQKPARAGHEPAKAGQEKAKTQRLGHSGTAPLRADEALLKNPAANKRDVWAGGNTGPLHAFEAAPMAEADFSRILATVKVPGAAPGPQGPKSAASTSGRT